MSSVYLIVQAALWACVAILIVLALVFSSLLSAPKKRSKILRSDTSDDETPPDNQASPSTQDSTWREQQQRAWEEEKRRKEEEEASIRPIYEKYPEIFRFEILYWRGVSKPWWWNNYAKELVEYANEYFPWNKVDYYSTYNSNSKGEDYNYPPFHDRIVSLRPRKISKHPLVIINYNQEYIMVNSRHALEEMMDRIDAEWYRQYGFKKTYRNSPLTYRAR